MKYLAVVCSGIFILLGASGCASIVKGSAQNIPITSTPSAAKITIVNEKDQIVYSGITPASVTLKKKKSYFSAHKYKVTIEKDGFAPQIVSLEPGVAAWYVGGNLGFGGLIGWLVVDPLTGGMWTLRPKDVSTTLGSQVSFNEGELQIILLEDVPAEDKANMTPIS